MNIPRFSLIWRYIFKELAQGFLLCFVSLLMLILISRGVQMRDMLLELNLSIFDMFLLFLYMVPMFMLIVVPFSCMFSVFLSFLRMSTDRELVALKAGGVSIHRLLPAPVVFCTFCALINIMVSLYGVSWGMGNFRDTIMDIAKNRARIVVQPGVFNQDIFGLTLFARQVNPDTLEMRNVIFEDRARDAQKPLTILADRGTISSEPNTASILFSLQDGHIYRADGEQFGILGFERYEVRLDMANVFSGAVLETIRPKEMSWEMLDRIHAGQTNDSARMRLRVAIERQKRWALPVACVILGFFAMPLACMFDGVRRQMGVLLSLLMFLVYYSLFSLGMSAAESGVLAPGAGIWAPNALFAVFGILGMYMTVRERVPTFQSVLLRIPFFRKRSDLRSAANEREAENA
ncbi:LPS export ABC transporter permease LptF [Deltaproteobacteria bacterium]|nr:LPS export ABC transporter permease LptF [Deltaproteobacteria bacterium]